MPSTEQTAQIAPLSINSLAADIHKNAVAHGWWGEGQKLDRNVGELLALAHGELSEALEEYRNGHFDDVYYSEGGKPEGGRFEVADTIIRLLDMAESRGWDMEAAILLKHHYNLGRSYRHGGKLA